jgi:hypothetical protein
VRRRYGWKFCAFSLTRTHMQLATSEYIKGSVLAISVFGIYDILIYQTLRRNHDNVQTVDGPIGGRQVPIASHSHPANSQIASIQWPPDDDTSGISLWGHFIAGGLAGAAQSIVMSTWEVGRYWWSRRQSRPQHIVSRVNHAFVFRRLIHHSLGYAALFGSYECLRRILFTVRDHYWGAVLMPSLDDHMQDMQTTDQWNNVPLSSLGTAFVAGGFAGQLHYIVDHHTLQWKRQATAKSASQSKRAKSSTTCSSSSSSSSSGTTSNRTTLSPGSLLRASCGSFLPTALCFVAFQYGGELTESLLRKDDNRDELRF